jgi:hypothetical protein
MLPNDYIGVRPRRISSIDLKCSLIHSPVITSMNSEKEKNTKI